MNNSTHQGFIKKPLTAMIATGLATAILAGCASAPQKNAEVEQLRSNYEQLAGTEGGQQYAPVVLKEAEDSLETLEGLVAKGAEPDAIAQQQYATEKKMDIARETVRMKKAEEVVSNAEIERKDLLLTLREQEADEAKQQAAVMSAKAAAAEEYAEMMEDKASSLENQVSDLTTEQTDRGLVLTLGSILFEFDSADLKPGSKRTLEKVASFLNDYEQRDIRIEGFTDSTGAENYNEKLSQDRAQAVKDVLVDSGVADNRISVKGYGEEYPVASNDSDAGRQENRRVEIIVSNQDDTPVEERTAGVF